SDAVCSDRRPIKRLLAEMVAGGQKAFIFFIQQNESEHPDKIVKQSVALLLVKMHQDFAIAVSLKAVPLVHELGAQFDVVVNFAVADHPHRSIFVTQRLPAAFEVDDRQSRGSEQAMPLQSLLAALVVRTAMSQQFLRSARPGAHVVVETRRGIEGSVNSTHLSVFVASRSPVRKHPATAPR